MEKNYEHRCHKCLFYDEPNQYCNKKNFGSIGKDFGYDCEYFKYNDWADIRRIREIACEEAVKVKLEHEREEDERSISEAQREWFAKTREIMLQDEMQYYRDMGWMPMR